VNRLSFGLPLSILLLFSWAAVAAQESFGFDDLQASEELREISELLQNEDIDAEFLADAGSRIVGIETAASGCVAEAGDEIARLDARLEPLREVSGDVSPQVIDQLNALTTARDLAIGAQAQCASVIDEAGLLQEQITERQTSLSQQFLSNRSDNIVDLVLELPQRAASWPARLKESLELNLARDMTPSHFLWLVVISGLLAAIVGAAARIRFSNWYHAAGGDHAEPRFNLLLVKPVAEFAPLWMVGAAIVGILHYSLIDASIEQVLVRLAWAILLFGTACVVISWATGPLSPSADVKGLIPDHVKPIRRRLQILFLVICASFIILGAEWLSVRVTETYVSGRASMIFLVAVAFMYLLLYLPNIPGVKGRYRVLRYLALAVTLVCILAVFAGYQNFAAFLIHGLTRTGLALFVVWILLWLIFVAFAYLIEEDTPTARRVRASLGIAKSGSGTGIGFMRLIADLVLWISFIVYMIYVWDESGSTLNKLEANVMQGWQLGGIELVPIKIIGGILIFAGVTIVIGWLKRWIDRQWLQHFVVERGARDAIVTLIGYVGFVVAVFIALAIAEVDLTGIALISGALAIGIGFGMQEIASNFVSGLILLFERPIRAGDFVTVGDVEGFVRRISIRATEIETLDNQNVLVPNSELVSGRVVNWVLRDTHGRLLVKVGVAYGSDVDTVREILERVARDHDEVISDGRAPAPRALFMGFGDSSLDFELRVRVQRIERRFSVLSDLNFVIDAEFRKAGITIPFPQRDLHIVSYPTDERPAEQTPVVDTDVHERTMTAADYGTRRHSESIEVDADLSDVWRAFTDVELMKKWLIVDGEFAAQIGGYFDLEMRDGAQITGRADVFLPMRRVRAVLSLGSEEKPLPSGPITIEVSFRRADKITTATVSVAGIPDSEDWEEYYRLSVDRWKTALSELRSFLLN
jgi:small-conductance mechanosensitive channel/uncharacterized protein YndB with AHSA1/START domain